MRAISHSSALDMQNQGLSQDIACTCCMYCTRLETIVFIAEMITDEVKEEGIHSPIYPHPKVHQSKLINTGSSVFFLPIH